MGRRWALRPFSSPAPIVGLLPGLVLSAIVTAGCDSGAAKQDGLHPQIGFAFDVDNLQTDHQFPGQRNTFHVSYQYRDGLQGSGYDPAGHPVTNDTYPYFQDVRTEMISYIQAYPHRSDFYEVFTENIARDLMDKYPQLSSIDVRVDIPAYGGVPVARTGTVHLTRQ